MKRTRLISIVVAVIVLGGLAFAILRAREPSYQGRTLSEWIEEGNKATHKFDMVFGSDPGQLEADHDWQAAGHAVKQIGYEAAPLLLKWAQAEDSPMKKKLIEWLEQHPSFHFKVRSADESHKMANVGFWLIGELRKTAWPGIMSGTGTAKERRSFAIFQLVDSGMEKDTLLPLLLHLIHDEDNDVQLVAASRFNYFYPKDAEAAGVYKMFPYLKNEPTYQSTTNQPPVK